MNSTFSGQINKVNSARPSALFFINHMALKTAGANIRVGYYVNIIKIIFYFTIFYIITLNSKFKDIISIKGLCCCDAIHITFFRENLLSFIGKKEVPFP